MVTAQPNLAFDTLAYVQALVARGFEQKQAESLVVVTRDFVISGQATNAFVQSEIKEAKSELKHEMALLENRLNKANAKMLAFAVTVILAGIPIVQAFLQKLG